MPYYVKTEKFNLKALNMTSSKRNKFIAEHKSWVQSMQSSGIKVFSGYLIDRDRKPGGGGLLIIDCNSYNQAESRINKDPMIINKLVDWKLHEYIPLGDNSIFSFIEDMLP